MRNDDLDGLGDEPDGALEDEAEVTCPHCGELVMIVLDRSGGTDQDYIQDCDVCCRPWHVQVHYAAGAADVTVSQA